MENRGIPNVPDKSDIKITTWDLDTLHYIIGQHATTWSWKSVAFLVREMMRATVVNDEEIPVDVVTMRSRVAYREDDSDIDRVVTLAYPGDRQFIGDALSVLTPAGSALLGLSEGQAISYDAPDGYQKSLSVLKILSQPEGNCRMGGALPSACGERPEEMRSGPN